MDPGKQSPCISGGGKRTAAGEIAYGQQARRFFHGGISAVLGLLMDQAEAYIAAPGKPW